MNCWHDISPTRIRPDEFMAVIEISKGGKNKYELDKESGMLRLDRVLHTSTHYPANYGFIPRTYSEDGDPLDALVLCSESIMPMTLVQCRPIGVLRMLDDGMTDEKIISVCISDPFYSTYHEIEELPPHLFHEIRHFYEVYKMLENKETMVKQIEGRLSAEVAIAKCIELYKSKFA